MSIRTESCSCVVHCVAEVEELRLASRKRKHRQKRRGRARVPRSMPLAPPNKRGKRRDRRDVGERDRGGKTTARFQLARGAPKGASRVRRRVSARGREKARFDGRRSGSWTRRTFTGFRTKRSRIRRRGGRIRREAAASLRIDRGVRDSTGARCARKKTPRPSAGPIRLSPLSRRETRCGSVARPSTSRVART